MKIYGYARISTRSQSIERQVRNILAAYPDAIILKEAYTGTKVTGRKEFEKLLKAVKPGDMIVFDSVSRMSRNAEEGMAIYMELYQNGIELRFLKEPVINTATYKAAIKAAVPMTGTNVDVILEGVNKYLTILAGEQIKVAFDQAQKEVDDLHKRTREGMETARLNGKQIGQKSGKKLAVKKKEPTMEIIRKHSKSFGGMLSDEECMKLAGVSRNTYYRYKREMAAEKV